MLKQIGDICAVNNQKWFLTTKTHNLKLNRQAKYSTPKFIWVSKAGTSEILVPAYQKYGIIFQ
jgi:hypothetical protein